MAKIKPSVVSQSVISLPYMLLDRTVGHYTIIKSYSYEEYYVIYEENDNGESTMKKMDVNSVNRFMNVICKEPENTYDIEKLLK